MISLTLPEKSCCQNLITSIEVINMTKFETQQSTQMVLDTVHHIEAHVRMWHLRNNFSLPVNYRWLTHVVGGQITKY